MPKFMMVFRTFLTTFLFLVVIDLKAQDTCVSYSQKVDVKKYEGHRFRFQARVRAELTNDSAAARLWARVDKQKGIGFFDNMDKKSIRNAEWKNYSIEGKIDTGATQLVFGALCIFNGKFYYDDLKVDVEIQKGKWLNLFTADFEDASNNLNRGIGFGDSHPNKLYKAEVGSSPKPGDSRFLVIEGIGVPTYGVNDKVGTYANVNGIRLYYEIYGDGTPLVVLHGNGGSIENASPFYPDLIKKYKVIAVDSRAQGKSGDTDAPLTYEMMAADVNALLDQLQIDSVLIWGQSDGAILSLILAMDYPKKVKKVVSFGANIQPDSLAIFQWAIDGSLKILKESKDAKEKKLNQLMFDYPKIPYSKLSQIKAPVLVVAGDRDVIRPEHTLKIFQHIPNSQLCIIPGSTHGAAWEQKDYFLQMIQDFFDKPFKMPDTKDWY